VHARLTLVLLALWFATSLLSQTDPSGTHRTFGDNWLGAEMTFHRQTTHLPTIACSYAIKIPSSAPKMG
jgi:hypothetical protein